MADKFWSQASFDNPADLKIEFDRMIDGYAANEGIGQIMVLRSMSNTYCVCYNPVTGGDNDCKYCKGESYVWTESYHRAYFTQTFGRSIAGVRQQHILENPGYMDEGKALCYMKASAAPSAGDKIFRIRLNDDGSIYYYTGIERIEKWEITAVEDKRYDRARLAYYICLCEREDA